MDTQLTEGFSAKYRRTLDGGMSARGTSQREKPNGHTAYRGVLSKVQQNLGGQQIQSLVQTSEGQLHQQLHQLLLHEERYR